MLVQESSGIRHILLDALCQQGALDIETRSVVVRNSSLA